MTYTLVLNDILSWAAEYNGPKFHAIFCDPPYHLTSINKRFSKSDAAPAKEGVYQRSSAGFMGQQWDGGDIAFNPDTWAALSQHLYPGGFIMAFASSRGWHRMASAMEDSGLVIHPSLFGWNFLSGFPKSTSISNQIDKAAGVKGKPIGKIAIPARNRGGTLALGGGWQDEPDIIEPATELAKTWAGHRYGAQAIKPAIEPLIIAHKPLNFELIYGIISEITFYMEVICSYLNAPDAETLMSHLHQTLKVVVDNSAHVNVESWEFLSNVKFAGLNSESNLASLTLQSFVVEFVPTKDAMHHLVKIILTGQEEVLPVRDISTSGSEGDILLNIALLWKDILGELLSLGSMFITSMETHLITDLKILSSYLSQITLNIMQDQDGNGWLSLAQIVEALLKSQLVKLQLLGSITVTDNAILKLAETEKESTAKGLLPIIVAQVPYQGRPVDNITETGAGAWNIDGGRIGTDEELGRPQTEQHFFTGLADNGWNDNSTGKGRWPANLLLDEAGAALLDHQSGESVSRHSENRNGSNAPSLLQKGFEGKEASIAGGHNDSGGASRMFFQSNWHYEILEQLENADPLKYEPKVSTSEREAGLDELPVQTRNRVNSGGYENDPKFAPTKMKNHHPTLKPISLTKYLATLLLPPDAYAPRRILVPFAGSGSEGIGCILAGWEEVVMIEASPDYVPIAEARLKWWSQWPGWGQTDADKILTAVGKDDRQLDFFDL